MHQQKRQQQKITAAPLPCPAARQALRLRLARGSILKLAAAPVVNAAPPRREITLVKAVKFPLLPSRRFGANKFQNGFEPARMRWIISDSHCPLAESFGTREPGNELMNLFTAPFDKGRYLAPPGPAFGVPLNHDILRKYAPGLL